MAAMQIEQLRSRVRGAIVQPDGESYDSVRRLYNGMIDKRPAVIVRCVDVADVIAAIDYARTNNLLTAVRGGGHNGAGLGSCDDGLVIDLSQMRGIHVDPAERTVRVEGGALWGDVDHATHPFGLAVPCSATRIGGGKQASATGTGAGSAKKAIALNGVDFTGISRSA